MTSEHHAVNGTGKPSPTEVAGILRDRIRTGALRGGSRMPTQNTLADEFGVERRTIRQALELLRDDGLITAAVKGAPARVVPSSPGRDTSVEEPQLTDAGLGPRILEAFRSPDVLVDAVCLTSESLNLALAEPLRLIRTGRLSPRSVKIRILLPSRDLAMAFPRAVEESGDDRGVHQRWLSLRNSHGKVLVSSFEALRTLHGLDVEVTLKALPFTPTFKVYLLNGTAALFAYYNVEEREESIDGTLTTIYDTLGGNSKLFRFVRGTGARDDAYVTESQEWFDSLWGTLAKDITLGS
ncbi:GntR family transcriptional regulator [Streptomyces sp. NPDC051018]|uniref:GntR family transcriptional regulator n=1 Tax=Streptomyces sp. NPDC051018 TaxID=3365639 RepID=UPI003796FEC9